MDSVVITEPRAKKLGTDDSIHTERFFFTDNFNSDDSGWFDLNLGIQSYNFYLPLPHLC